MKKNDNKGKPVSKKLLAIFLFAIAVALFIIFIFMAGHEIMNPRDDAPSETEPPISITGDSEYVDDSMVAPMSVQYKGESGITYTLGSSEMINIENVRPAIALNPTAAEEDYKVGFYFEPDIGNIISEYEDIDYQASDETVFYIGQWTDQYIYPAKYQDDEDYGVAWVVDEKAVQALSDEKTEKKISVRTIDLTNKRFLDAFYITIGFNEEGKVSFTGTKSADISVVEPTIDRAWLIETALTYFNDDGWSIATTISQDEKKKNEHYNPYEPIIETSRYVVEILDDRTYSPYILNRGEQGEPTRGIGLGEDQFPVIAITPCYDIGNANNGLVTIYLHPSFLYGGMGAQYLGYSDWNDPDCSPEMSLY